VQCIATEVIEEETCIVYNMMFDMDRNVTNVQCITSHLEVNCNIENRKKYMYMYISH